jgi:hypothetical protein
VELFKKRTRKKENSLLSWQQYQTWLTTAVIKFLRRGKTSPAAAYSFFWSS